MYDELQSKIGQEITYKAMCELLHLERATGNTKIKQMNHIIRFYELEKIGTKYLVKAKREQILDKNRNYKGGNRSKYSKLMRECVLINLIQGYRNDPEKEDITLGASKYFLLEMFGLANGNFRYARKYPLYKLAPIYNIESPTMYELYYIAQKELSRIFDRFINSLKDDDMISVSAESVVVSNGNHRTATEDENKIINEIEYDALVICGYKTKQEACLRDWHKYKKTTQGLLNDRLKHISYYYTSHNFNLRRGLEGVDGISVVDCEEIKSELNRLILERIKQELSKPIILKNENYEVVKKIDRTQEDIENRYEIVKSLIELAPTRDIEKDVKQGAAE